jgi:NAD+ kinase
VTMSSPLDLSTHAQAMPRLRQAAILYHPMRPRAHEEATWLQGELEQAGVRTLLADGWQDGIVEQICKDQDLVVAFGGDGTIIRVTRLAASQQVPILGVNLGRIGFLAEITPDLLHGRVEALVEGKFWLERRSLLEAEWLRGGESFRYTCVNEVAVARGPAPRAVQVRTFLDGEEFIVYTADGVLVATATGSTAYSLAAGGPILYPESPDFLITPVAPHLHIGRSVIVPGDSTVTLQADSERPAVMSVDGQDERSLGPGDVVNVRRSELFATFVRMGPRHYFYDALADRLR